MFLNIIVSIGHAASCLIFAFVQANWKHRYTQFNWALPLPARKIYKIERSIVKLSVFNPRRHRGGDHSDPPPLLVFLALNFCSCTNYQKLWHNCSLFDKTSFDPN